MRDHIRHGELMPGVEIGIKIDQTLTQDAMGPMAYLQFEAMGLSRVQTEISASYVDINTLQTGHESTDDQIYLQTVAARYGVQFSKAGNGNCHHVHMQRFGKAGRTLLGTDPLASMAGALGMLAFSCGGLDVALAMCGRPYHLLMPSVCNVILKGKMRKWVSAKDLALELLRRLGSNGGAGKIFEFTGEGVRSLNVEERAAIAGMTAELGAVSAIFPSDQQTKAYLAAHGRGRDWKALAPDKQCHYDEKMEISLHQLEPMAAQAGGAEPACPVRKLPASPVHQVVIGGAVNGGYHDLSIAARILKGRTAHPDVSLVIAPASLTALTALQETGELKYLLDAGARILEPGNGISVGIGQVPGCEQFSLRTTHRNLQELNGARGIRMCICSVETAAQSAIRGALTSAKAISSTAPAKHPKTAKPSNALIVVPPAKGATVQIIRGPNIRPVPTNDVLPDDLKGEVLVQTGDFFSVDQILAQNADNQLQRSNIPALARYLFHSLDPHFIQHAREAGGGFILAGENYGQGASGEYAAMAMMYLKIRAVLAKSFSRTHGISLINFGILPLTFTDPTQAESIHPGDRLEVPFVRHMLQNDKPLVLQNRTKHRDYHVSHNLTHRQVEIILAGGLLNYIRARQKPR
ncbi:aconitate hydratase [Candidatus Sumerlaeota bacterium]|nr:aconitate hydratase [Candidatus Sumerlaeota bacterium]